MLCSVIFILGSIAVFAQDPVFTQYYNNPLQISPAFTGTTFAPKLHLNSRVQWPNTGFAYNTYNFSYDQFLNKYRIGIGTILQQDNAGSGILKTFSLQGMISYRLQINRGHFLKMGLSLGLIQRRLNWEKLIFSDQIDAIRGYLEDLVTQETRPEDLSVFSPDLGAGLMYYSEYIFVGYSIHHGNNPGAGFSENRETFSGALPLRHHLMAGGEIRFGNHSFISPTILFSHQAKINQLNFQVLGNIGTVYAGIGYRYWVGHPDAVLATAGVQYGMFRIGYSYDLTVSRLGTNSGGSHEVSFVINFDKSVLFKPPFRYSDCFEAFR